MTVHCMLAQTPSATTYNALFSLLLGKQFVSDISNSPENQQMSLKQISQHNETNSILITIIYQYVL